MKTFVPHLEQFNLMVKCLPVFAREKCFALHGGTAINLFLKNLPRYSLDIDLTFLPIESWNNSLHSIDRALDRISIELEQTIPCRIDPVLIEGGHTKIKLHVYNSVTSIKAEVSPVHRGVIYPIQFRKVQPAVERQFGPIEMNLVSTPEIYASKMLAALDRQKPKDLYDVHNILNSQRIDDNIRDLFMFRLISNRSRTFNTLKPRDKSIYIPYKDEFKFLMIQHVELEKLYLAKKRLISELVGKMSDSHKEFLISFLEEKPKWSLLNIPNAQYYPAVSWKIENMVDTKPSSKIELLTKVEEILYSSNPHQKNAKNQTHVNSWDVPQYPSNDSIDNPDGQSKPKSIKDTNHEHDPYPVPSPFPTFEM